MACSVSALASDDKVFLFDIPEQPLISSIRSLSNQTETLILFPFDLVENQRGAAVEGQFTAREALDRLLLNTDLMGGLSKTGVLTISIREASAPSHQGKPEMNNEKGLLATVVATLTGWFGATAVVAEPEPHSDGSNKLALEEVIVSAQKVNQNLQDVPISVDAFRSKDLRESGISRIDDLQQYTPGLNVSTISGLVSYTYIRGGGTNQFDAGSDPSVAYFIDDVYITGNTALQFELVDLERVEVLKGPQGTLFGRNAAAGAINVISKRPEDTFSAYAFSELANESAYTVRAGATGPVLDNRAQYRLMAYQKARDSYTTNLMPGVDDPDTIDHHGIRGAVSFALGDDIQLLASADYGSADNGMTNQVNLTDQPAFASPARQPLTAGQDFWHRYYNLDGHVETDFTAFTVTLDWGTDIGDLVSISAYRTGRTERLQDQDSSSLDALVFDLVEDTDSYSQEIRLSNSDERWDWVAGVYYYTADIDAKNSTFFGPDSLVSFAAPLFTINDHKITVDSGAVFGQASYRLMDSLSLTLGGRYTYDKKKSDRHYSTNAPPILAPALGEDYTVDFDDNWSSFNPMAVLEYRPTNETLYYLSWRTGFKSGGFQSLATTESAAETPFDNEDVTSYELGSKSDLWDGRLRINAAAFYVEYDDLQFSRLSDSGLGLLIENVGSASSLGGDLAISLAATGHVTLRMNYGYQDAEFDKYSTGGIDFSGNTLLRSPENKLSLIFDYGVPVADLNLILRGEYSYSDKVYYDAANTEEIDGFEVYQPSYSIYNARAILAPRDEKWEVSVWGKNLGDKEYCGNIVNSVERAFAICAPAQPLTAGVSLRWNFF